MIVYTSIYGNYDTLKQPQVTDTAVAEWFCVTDQYQAEGIWQPLKTGCSLTARRCARRAKLLSHLMFPKEEITIWHGGNVQLKGDLMNLVALLDNADIAVLKHPRGCIYAEAKAVIDWGLDNQQIVQAQMERYRQASYPENNRLHAAFLIVRRNTPQIRELNTLWWNEVTKGSHRDQLSFDYCLWKLGIKVQRIPGNLYIGPNYERFPNHASTH